MLETVVTSKRQRKLLRRVVKGDSVGMEMRFDWS